ncbi:MAG: prepilin-type N-terminal cleavage/methylation domain-containing protein [Prochlorococcus marinus CUG1434]|nr:prepilin-type N-terminal cleavage/methylation domain-containing protein [Prochlorococcus marinus CUG1434]
MTILQNYLKSKKVQKVLTTKPGEEGFSLVELVVVIAVLAILSAVAIPAFNNVQANARASAVQNGLVNGLKECAVRDAENLTTAWADAASFSNTSAFRGFTIRAMTGTNQGNDSCFAAEAISNPSGQNSNFTIYLDDVTGAAVKRCTVPTKPGCQTVGGVNIWK